MSFLLKILLEFKRTMMKLLDGCGDFLHVVIDDNSFSTCGEGKE